MKKLKIIILIVGLMQTWEVLAEAIFSISPIVPRQIIRSDSYFEIPYKVVNNSNKIVQDITISGFGNLTISNNTCKILAPHASCEFRLTLTGLVAPTISTISPEVCAFNKTICSQPIASKRYGITSIAHPLRAFVGLSNNTVLPIVLSSNNTGVPQSVISGFVLNEPAGIAVNYAGTRVYVTDAGTNTLVVIDTTSNRIISRIPVGNVPAGVVVNHNDGRVYVANYNDGQSNGIVSVVDALTLTVVANVAVGYGPWGLAVTPDDSKVYISNSYRNTVTILDAAKNHLVGKPISVGESPFGIAITPDGKKVYVANTASNTISVINTSTNEVIKTILVGRYPKGVAIHPDGQSAYVANWQDATISIIHISTDQVSQTFPVLPGPVGLAINPSGTELYVTSDQSNRAAIVNLKTGMTQTVLTNFPQLSIGNFIG